MDPKRARTRTRHLAPRLGDWQGSGPTSMLPWLVGAHGDMLPIPDAVDGAAMPADVAVRPRLSPVYDISRGAATMGGYGDEPAPEPLVFPPWLFPPFGAFPLDFPLNRLPVAIAAGATLSVLLPAVPDGRTGILNALGLTTSIVADTRVTLRINQQPTPPILGIVGALGSLDDPTKFPAPVIIAPAAVADVLIENTGAAAITAMVRVLGWWY